MRLQYIVLNGLSLFINNKEKKTRFNPPILPPQSGRHNSLLSMIISYALMYK
jgi:hypothetical protein